jgi:putative peptidoglycan lipid II flippase
MNYALRFAFLIDIPSAVGLYLLALPIVRVLFERGEFTDATAVATAGALCFFALKIPFVSVARNLVPGFFALKDAKTPVAASAVAVVVNAACAYALMHPMLHRGLALALVISSAVNFLILLVCFRRKVGPIGWRRIAASVGRTCIASAIMGVVIVVGQHYAGLLEWHSFAGRLSVLLGLISLGAAVFLAAIRLISPEEFHALAGMIGKRRRKGPTVIPAVNGNSSQSA